MSINDSGTVVGVYVVGSSSFARLLVRDKEGRGGFGTLSRGQRYPAHNLV